MQINLLGGFDVRIQDQVRIMLPTRKARALVAILSLSTGIKTSRQALTGMLWGRSAEEQARATLRQTLSSIRKQLSPHASEVLFTEKDEVGLDPARCSVDAAVFEQFVEQGSMDALGRARSVCQGEFLAGLSLREESFMSWLDGERYRLQELARRGFNTYLDHLLSTGGHVRTEVPAVSARSSAGRCAHAGLATCRSLTRITVVQPNDTSRSPIVTDPPVASLNAFSSQPWKRFQSSTHNTPAAARTSNPSDRRTIRAIFLTMRSYSLGVRTRAGIDAGGLNPRLSRRTRRPHCEVPVY